MDITCKYETTGDSEGVIFRIFTKNMPNKFKQKLLLFKDNNITNLTPHTKYQDWLILGRTDNF